MSPRRRAPGDQSARQWPGRCPGVARVLGSPPPSWAVLSASHVPSGSESSGVSPVFGGLLYPAGNKLPAQLASSAGTPTLSHDRFPEVAAPGWGFSHLCHIAEDPRLSAAALSVAAPAPVQAGHPHVMKSRAGKGTSKGILSACLQQGQPFPEGQTSFHIQPPSPPIG